MIREQRILKEWRTGKQSRQFYRLVAEIEVGFEYRGSQFGHPSNYAAVKLTATPSMGGARHLVFPGTGES